MSTVADYANAAGNIGADASSRRAAAVAAALEVIASRASAGDESFALRHEFSRLSTYADQIQAAIDETT